MVGQAVYELVETEIRDISYTLGNVLITGGTGTFGHAFARALLDRGVRRVAIYSRDEVKQARMKDEFNDPRLRFYLGDVRDEPNLERACRGADTVVHASSLKRLERSGECIDEFIKTIVQGSLNVINACHNAGVTKCLALSTDKACSSSTPYGNCKAVMESCFAAGTGWGHATCSALRYGNVVGSRGSVREYWAGLYEAGKPLPITDYRMTRFWLPIDGAVDLAFLALQRMRGGEIFIPKNVAHSKIRDKALEWFPGAEFVEIGKRAYEKIDELMVSAEEADRCHDCGDVYVLTPFAWHWKEPYGLEFPLVEDGFEYTSRD